MEFIFAIPLIFVPLVLPVITGLMAKHFGRKFWPWFFLGILIPFIANIILHCLPDKSKNKNLELRPVENENVFDHLFIPDDPVPGKNHETYYSARA